MQKMLLDFETIVFELVLLNTRFNWEIILVNGRQYVYKQSQYLRYF